MNFHNALTLVFLAASLPTMAETRICTAEVGTALLQSPSGEFSAGAVEVAGEKFMHSDRSGKWQASRYEVIHIFWPECREEGNFCDAGETGAGGYFVYKPETNTFWVHMIWSGDAKQLMLIGGSCAKADTEDQ